MSPGRPARGASASRSRILGALLAGLLATAPASAGGGTPQRAAESGGGRLQITYLGNEGVLVAAGETKVLIDALYRDGVPGYPVHAAGLRSKLESGAPPFDGVDVVLATHFHADHFDPGAVSAHLAAAPEARFISTRQAVDELPALPPWEAIASRVTAALPPEGERIVLEHRGVTVTVIQLHHGRESPVESLGFLVALGGRKLLHVGDTEATVEEMAALDLAAEGIDVALIPYWHLLSPRYRSFLAEVVRPRHVVPIHLPAEDAPVSSFSGHDGRAGLCAFLEREVPGAVILAEPLASRTF